MLRSMMAIKEASASLGDHEITFGTIKEIGDTMPATCVRPIIAAASKIVETIQVTACEPYVLYRPLTFTPVPGCENE